jgi:hypothetical protein
VLLAPDVKRPAVVISLPLRRSAVELDAAPHLSE